MFAYLTHVNGNTLSCINGAVFADRTVNSVNLQNCTIINAQIFIVQNFGQIKSYVAFSTFTNTGKGGLKFSSVFSGTSIVIENNIFNMGSNYSAIEFNGEFYNTPINITNNIINNISQAITISSSNITNSNLLIVNNVIQNSTKLLHITNTSFNSSQLNVSYNTFNSTISNGASFDNVLIESSPIFNSQFYIMRNNIVANFQNYNIVGINGSILDTSIFIMYNIMSTNFNVFSNNIINSQNSIITIFCNGLKNIVNSNCTQHTNSNHVTNSQSLTFSNTKSSKTHSFTPTQLSQTISTTVQKSFSGYLSLTFSESYTNTESISTTNTKSASITNTQSTSITNISKISHSISVSKSLIFTKTLLRSTLSHSLSNTITSPTKTLSKSILISTTSIELITYSHQKTLTQKYPQRQKQDNPTTIVPSQVTTTTTATTVASTIISPITSLQMSRFTAVTTLIKCNDIDEDLSYAEYQIQVSIGSTQFSTLSGSVFIASLITAFISFVMFSLHYTKTKTNKMTHIILRTVTALLLSFYTPLIIKDSLTLLIYTNYKTVEFWLGFVSVFMICMTMMTITATLTCKFKCCFTNDHFENTTDYPYKEYFLIFFTESEDINSITKRCYYLMDLFCAFIFSIMLTVRFNDSKDCTANAVVMLVLSLMYFLYTAIIRPFRELSETIINIANAFTQLILTILMILYMASYDVAYYISIVSLVISIQYICSPVILIIRWIHKRCTIKNNQSDPSPILTLNSDTEVMTDMLPTVMIKLDDSEINPENDIDMTIIHIKSEGDIQETNDLSEMIDTNMGVPTQPNEECECKEEENEMLSTYTSSNDSIHSDINEDPYDFHKNLDANQILTIRLNTDKTNRMNSKKITREELEKFVYNQE